MDLIKLNGRSFHNLDRLALKVGLSLWEVWEGLEDRILSGQIYGPKSWDFFRRQKALINISQCFES